MNEKIPIRERRKFELQTLAFLLIIMPSIGLYPATLAGITWLVMLLLIVILCGIVIGLWTS